MEEDTSTLRGNGWSYRMVYYSVQKQFREILIPTLFFLIKYTAKFLSKLYKIVLEVADSSTEEEEDSYSIR